MPIDTVTTPVEAPTVTETPAPPIDAPSIADHQAAFSPDAPKVEPLEGETLQEAKERARDEQGRFSRERHRAQSQKATAEDVGRIGQLTKKWRTEETSRKALEEKYAALEREVQTLKTPKVDPPVAPPNFGDAEPQLEQFTASDDPYRDYMRALAAYDRKKEAAESAQSQHETAQQQHEARSNEEIRSELKRLGESYQSKLDAFIKTHPDWQQVIDTMTEPPTPVLHKALLELGPDFVYALGQRPDVRAELMLLSEGKLITQESVAMMRRLLSARMPVATTGSTAPPPTYLPPKPPNPVRTGPIKAADDPPGEGASIADHARYYGPNRR